MIWTNNEEENTDKIIENISDGELFELESATRIPYRDYSKHIAAVEAYEQGLAKRRRYEKYQASQKADNNTKNFKHYQVDNCNNKFDPLLTAIQVYDKDGYDVDGFDSQGYDREGYNRAGFNRYTGYDRGGYDIHGNSRGGDLTRFPKL